VKTDIEIARDCAMKPVAEVADALGIDAEDLELYGRYKAKFSDALWSKLDSAPQGKLVLVTAINPTPAGEGKTTVTVGLGQALSRLGKKAVVALREPSLGPCFGMKGGATGGGYAQLVPMEDLNLHFTGDFHAITAANNLLAALLDNHLHQGNALNIDSQQITFRRCMDINDRALRHTVVGLGGRVNGVTREDGFMITVASEIMAILCLARDLADLKRRLARMIVAWRRDDTPVTVGDLQATGALAVLLKDALKPNLVQTLEHSPAIVHGGPFANIAHGCSSVRGTRLALKLADIVVTEAGFGADLGAEKFFNIKCRASGLRPDAAVLVATVRALKYNGGVAKRELGYENLDALRQGLGNLGKHIENLHKFGVPVVVTLNVFTSDTDAEHALIDQYCRDRGCCLVLSRVWEQGGAGGEALALRVVELLENSDVEFRLLYPDALPLAEKIATIATEIYGAQGVSYSPAAHKALKRISDAGMASLPICMAKTQYSLSDDPKALGRPEGFRLHIRDVQAAAGAGFVVAYAGDIMTMPGLPATPAALSIDIDDNGVISGLF
jgi:formate--tetrahydrofolate ligase